MNEGIDFHFTSRAREKCSFQKSTYEMRIGIECVMRALYRRQTIFETNNKTKNRWARSIHGSRIGLTSAWAPRMDRLVWRCVIRASLHEYACVRVRVGKRRERENAKRVREIRRNECSTYNIRYIMYIVLYIRTNHWLCTILPKYIYISC